MMDITFPKPKKRITRIPSRIAATASFFPEGRMTNQDIIDAGDLAIAPYVIEKSIGVRERRTAEKSVVDSDLLTAAAQQCLANANIDVDQLDKLLVTKFLGDHILPMTASMVQRKLGAKMAFHAVDIEGGTNSFLIALDLATRYISTTSQNEQYILIVSGGLHTVPVSKKNPRTAFLFGDGAAAVLLSTAESPHFLASYQYSNFHLYNSAGSRTLKMDQWVSDALYQRGNYELLYDLYEMENWKNSMDFYVRAARETRDNLLAESGLAMSDIDLVLVTENNKPLRDLTLEALGVPESKSLSLINEFGNTMSAMLPMQLDAFFRKSKDLGGQYIMLISHGEGASGGGVVYKT